MRPSPRWRTRDPDRGRPRPTRRAASHQGDLWVLIAALDWALYSVLLRRRPAELSALAFLTVTVALGTIPLAGLYAWDLAQGHGFEPSLPNLAALGYVALFPSVLAYVIRRGQVES